MKIEKSRFEMIAYTPALEQVIELAGRVCWKSEDRITGSSHEKFIRMLKSKNHASVLEHGSITVKIICDRGISHELVRHRLASFSQESTRYACYSDDKFDNEITVIDIHPHVPEESLLWTDWWISCNLAEQTYLRMVENGVKPEMARSVLPNSLKTEVFITANPREWLHIFEMRTSSSAHPQMREIMVPLKAQFSRLWPSIFGDVNAN